MSDYIKQKDTSVLLVTSLSDYEEVNRILDNLGSEVSIIFIQLSDLFSKQKISDWLKWIFIQNEKNQTELHKTNWNLSAIRIKIMENEKKLKSLVKQYDKSLVL